MVTDKILNQISALDPKICKSIARFTFDYSDVSYEAHNNARGVTDASIIRFAQACPNLTHFLLPNVGHGVTDASLIALTQHCPKLAEVYLTGARWSGRAFETLLANPELGPKLKRLSLHDISENKETMKPLREASKARPDLIIYMVSKTEEKHYGDWEMVTKTDVYYKGRKCPDGRLPKNKKAYQPKNGGFGGYDRYEAKQYYRREFGKALASMRGGPRW